MIFSGTGPFETRFIIGLRFWGFPRRGGPAAVRLVVLLAATRRGQARGPVAASPLLAGLAWGGRETPKACSPSRQERTEKPDRGLSPGARGNRDFTNSMTAGRPWTGFAGTTCAPAG